MGVEEPARAHLGALLGDGAAVLEAAGADVGATREDRRRRRIATIALVLWALVALAWWRALASDATDPFAVHLHVNWLLVVPIAFFVLLIAAMAGVWWWSGRSPHLLYRPEQVDVRLADVIGIEPVKEDVVRSINLFLAHKTFTHAMGGTPRRGLLFEGAPGTGKTHLAKAMAAEAGVPFFFVSATAFQSMFYGATARKIRAYFKALRKTARREGGAIGFIEEIDAIASARGGLSMTAPPPDQDLAGCQAMSALPAAYAAASSPYAEADRPVVNGAISEGVGGVVNELLVQLQSFDEPLGAEKALGKLVEGINLLLPAHRQLRRRKHDRTNLLVIAATNRADNLDPALLRPGRFDRRLSFGLPDAAGRRALVDHFLASKAHDPALDEPERRDALASVTQGYTPVMIEHLCDEALVNAVRRGAAAMSWDDVEHARLTEEVGLGQPVGYTDAEKRLIATHEAGHATAAYLLAPDRRLEVLSIVKRREALGMLAHGDRDEVFTRSRAELRTLIQISLAGQCAEETFFGDVSTGPSGDLLYATNVAAQMVGAAGMTGSLISYAAVQSGAFSDTNLVGRVLADGEGRRTVDELLHEQQAIVRERIAENRHLVSALRDALLERDELIGHEITDVLDAARRVGPEPASGDADHVVDLRDDAPVRSD
jgi:ATP-dependent Zn protease